MERRGSYCAGSYCIVLADVLGAPGLVGGWNVTGFIRQHIPGYIDGAEPEVDFYSSTEELLALPWIESWSKYKEFTGYMLDPSSTEDTGYLMAFMKGGAEWWTIGLWKGLRPELPVGVYLEKVNQ
jgi:hypothetical protein